MEKNNELLKKFQELAREKNHIEPELYSRYNVKRGLRNADGSGVLVGLTTVGDVHGYVIDENEAVPAEGRLRYRGLDVTSLVKGIQSEGRLGFEETSFLLLFGKLPNKQELKEYNDLLAENREMSQAQKEDIIMRSPSPNIMNKLATAVLQSYSYDPDPENRSLHNVIRQTIELIARFPIMVAYSFQAKNHFFSDQSLMIHKYQNTHSTAELILSLIRDNKEFTPLEAEILDLSLVLHAEHGGGNNSSFTVHVVSSSDTDAYSAIAAAIGSLKGSKHGGANLEVSQMMTNIKQHLGETYSDKEIKDYLVKILRKQAYNKTGLIYGMGHAVYSLSDPRAILLKEKARDLAQEKGRMKEFDLFNSIENLAKEAFAEEKGNKIISANVDFYSGFVYDMLNIPQDLFTPLFAVARMAGWGAHLIEENICGGRIMRPAYKSVVEAKQYENLNKRK